LQLQRVHVACNAAHLHTASQHQGAAQRGTACNRSTYKVHATLRIRMQPSEEDQPDEAQLASAARTQVHAICVLACCSYYGFLSLKCGAHHKFSAICLVLSAPTWYRLQVDFAMVSLKKSMKWDEDVYGLEYDLVRQMVQLVSFS
jgi:hypothetical protein